jgi:hypothetical protein
MTSHQTLLTIDGQDERAADGSMCCVSSGYLADGTSCHCTIPGDVVEAAWAREVDMTGDREDRFFHFAWHGEVWLGFGRCTGEVRGVYCPIHCAERDARFSPRGQATARLAPIAG